MFALLVAWVLSTRQDARTKAVAETGINCTTGPGETVCDVPLSALNAFDSMYRVRVTETDPVPTDRTAASSMGSDQDAISVSGLAPSTSYTFDIIHPAVRPTIPEPLDLALQRLDWIIGFLLTAFVAAMIFAGR